MLSITETNSLDVCGARVLIYRYNISPPRTTLLLLLALDLYSPKRLACITLPTRRSVRRGRRWAVFNN